jgi:hypothetical protein
MGSKLGFGWACLLTSLMVLVTEVRGQAKIFNVMNYSAVADGATDNSQVNSYDIVCLLVSFNFIESYILFYTLIFGLIHDSKDVFEIFIYLFIFLSS